MGASPAIQPSPTEEAIAAHWGPAVAAPPRERSPLGWYVLAAYRLTDRWEPAARVERWDPDRGAGNDAFTRTTLGLNYHIAGDTRLAVNYEFRDDKAHPALDNLALAQYQISF